MNQEKEKPWILKNRVSNLGMSQRIVTGGQLSWRTTSPKCSPEGSSGKLPTEMNEVKRPSDMFSIRGNIDSSFTNFMEKN